MDKKNRKELSLQDKINIVRKNYNDDIVKKTMDYKAKYGFEINPRKGHELWNVEGDAFKHAFMSADMALNLGHIPSLALGIYHENETPNNPLREWNMDSWNNNQGREVAREIQREYGNKFLQLSKQQQQDIIADKIMQKMRNGDLITRPDDNRKYNGLIEKLFNNPTGYASNIETNQPSQQSDLSGYTNPLTGNNRIYTREDIASMSNEEFAQHEKEIDAQVKSMNGRMPTNKDMEQAAQSGGGVVHVESYTRSDGTRVKSYYRSRPNF